VTDPAEQPWIAAPGEALCLDFANTRFWRGMDQPSETLQGFGDLVAWCGAEAGLPAGPAASLADWAAADDAAAAAALAQALALRETIYRLFRAAAAPAEASPADLARLNEALAGAGERRFLEASGEGFGWRIPTGAAPAMALLTPVLWSAGDLLASRRLAKVRACANPRCEWLFLDDSKSGNRRWCSMSACGNRAKAHRHYARQKEMGR
jgi:predicted RNA-binding Zn ribbon-like protein